MDRTARLIGEVASRYGIRLDPDDPAFALVALNELALGGCRRKARGADEGGRDGFGKIG